MKGMEVSPFHSKNHLAVYHTCNRCGIGKKIHPRNRMSGTGGLRLCLRCDKLLAQQGRRRSLWKTFDRGREECHDAAHRMTGSSGMISESAE